MKVIKFNSAYLSGKEKEYQDEVFSNKHFAGNGKFTKKCQSLIENIVGGRVLLTTSCTAALELAAMSLNLSSTDEVIVPSYTFAATASAFYRTGAKIIFAEIDPNTLMIDINDVERKINKNTRAIVPVHYAGLPCEVVKISELCKSMDIDLIEDAAQGFGTMLEGGHLGSFGRFGTISFHETKNIHCGLGGAIYINETEDFDRVENIWERGTNRAKMFRGLVDKYSWVEPGSSFYPTELQSAFLLAQLESLDKNLDQRSSLTEEYKKRLKNLRKYGVILQDSALFTRWNHHAIACIFPTYEITEHVRKTLLDRGIHAYIGYVPLHSSPMGKKMGWKPGDLPITEDVSNRILRLPMHCEMTVDDVVRVTDELEEILG